MEGRRPTFGANEKLARYIEPEYRQNNRRAKPSAFVEDPDSKKNGLSVNSLEIHTENQIASIYSTKFNEPRPIAITIHTVADYNAAAQDVGIRVIENADSHIFEHEEADRRADSYRLDKKKGNESHCLVRYTRLFEEFQERRFAIRMAYKPTYREY